MYHDEGLKIKMMIFVGGASEIIPKDLQWQLGKTSRNRNQEQHNSKGLMYGLLNAPGREAPMILFYAETGSDWNTNIDIKRCPVDEKQKKEHIQFAQSLWRLRGKAGEWLLFALCAYRRGGIVGRWYGRWYNGRW